MVKNDIQTNYNWGTFINDRAIVEFMRMNKISKNLNLSEYYLLSFLVDLFNKSNIEYKLIEKERYIFVNNNFIFKNLLLLDIRDRQLQNYIKNLVKYGFIKRDSECKTFRYINVSNKLVELWKPKKVSKSNNNKLLNSIEQTDEHFEESIQWFIKRFNEIGHSNYKITPKVRELFAQQLKNGFTGNEMIKAVNNMYSSNDKNKYHKDNSYNTATPNHLLKDDNINKYLNQKF